MRPFVLLLGSLTCACAADLWVATDGEDAPDRGARERPFATIRYAVERALLPGDTRTFQHWFRDPGVGAGFNLSDAIRVTFCP